ncbi:MAG: alpha/beta hydrolase [Pseudomonadota bacterium]
MPDDRKPVLDPLIEKLLAASAGEPPVDTLGIEEARARMRGRIARLPSSNALIKDIRDFAIPARHGAIPARLYLPQAERPPLILFFHGGGWALCGLDTHDGQCRRLCADSGAAVLAVDYRLAPEHPFPAGFDDCLDATLWALEDDALPGIDTSFFVLAGDSAGGTLAAGVALALRDRGGPMARGQALFYPALQHPSRPSPSYSNYAEGFGLTRRAMGYFWDIYLAGAVPIPVYAAPMHADDLSGLPPAFIVTAECDVLRDEGEGFAERLHAAGIAVEQHRIPGVNHGFLALDTLLPAADATWRTAGVWISKCCGRSRGEDEA